jgi:hypothetical protein
MVVLVLSLSSTGAVYADYITMFSAKANQKLRTIERIKLSTSRKNIIEKTLPFMASEDVL